MTLPLLSSTPAKPAADQSLENWRFLWTPLIAETPKAPAPATPATWPLPTQTSTGSMALAVAEAMPKKLAQANLPTVLQAYRQNAD